ncbi:GTPase HflX, partial [bacterium]|nr:GTPase HflX [bacterium]
MRRSPESPPRQGCRSIRRVRAGGLTQYDARERAVLAAVEITTRAASASSTVLQAEEPLEELSALAESAGAQILARVVQQRASYDQATLIGHGKVLEIAEMVRALEADVVLFDHDLGGTQQRNLEKALGCKVVDRTQ